MFINLSNYVTFKGVLISISCNNNYEYLDIQAEIVIYQPAYYIQYTWFYRSVVWIFFCPIQILFVTSADKFRKV